MQLIHIRIRIIRPHQAASGRIIVVIMRARSHSALNDNFITATARCHQRQHQHQQQEQEMGRRGRAGTAASAIQDAPKKPSKRCRNVKCNKKLEGINAAAAAGQQVELQIPLCKERKGKGWWGA